MAEGPLDTQIEGLLERAGAVLVADYGRGVAAHPEIRRLLAGLRVPVVWDPHPSGAPPVPGARLVTPSRAEARHFAGGPAKATGYEQAVADAAELQRRWEAAGVAVTLGERGAVLSMGADTASLVPAPQIATGVDPCGAGDCLAAAAALALRDGKLLAEAVTEGVYRAAEFVAGTLGTDRPPGDAFETVRRVRESGGTVVATGGCFDLLHAGHVELLRQAKALGDCLVVCLNSDESVRDLKGPGRPVVGEQDRARVLAALDCVDAVLTFPERTPAELIERLRPDLWVKGGDYSPADLPETEAVRRHGGEVVILPYLAGRSTSKLVERVRA
jgi:D-beta-D-heptose 7-phosphate kinase/D-beta-D-heptose 1-phosphate adenosyltransferase